MFFLDVDFDGAFLAIKECILLTIEVYTLHTELPL